MTIQTRGPIARSLTWVLLAVQSFFWSVAAMAQEPDIKVDIDANGGGAAWYTNWWIWVLIALFVIVIVALSRGRTERV